MGEKKVKGKEIKNLFDNIRDCGDEYHINIGRRAGFTDDKLDHYMKTSIIIPKWILSEEAFSKGSADDDLGEEPVVCLLRHINNVLHDSISMARRESLTKREHELQVLLGIRKRED